MENDMSKSRSCEMKMFFTPVQMGVLNAFCSVMFFLNTVLYLHLEYKSIYKGNFSEYYIILSTGYEVLAFLFFLRIFYSKNIARIKYTFPFSKQIFIRDISLAINFIQLIILAFSVLFAINFNNKGVENRYLLGLILYELIIQISVSIVLPFLTKLLMNENFSSGFYVQTKAKFIIITILLTFSIPVFPGFVLRKICFIPLCNFSASIPFASFCLICVAGIITCYLISYLLFSRSYKKR